MSLLTKVSIRNFGAVQSADLDLCVPNVVFGPNYAGKSTIRAAIQYAMFGYCLRTDAKGDGIYKYVPDGSECSSITVGCAGIRVNVNVYPKGHKPQTEWYCMDPANDGEIIESIPDRAALWRELEKQGYSQAHARIAVDPISMLESRELSTALANLNVQTIDLAEACQSKLTRAETAEKVEWFRAWAKQRKLGCEDVADLKTLGAMSYERRTGMKRELVEAKAQCPPQAQLPDGVTASTAPTRLTVAREELRAAEETLRSLEAERRYVAAAVVDDPEVLAAEIEDLENRLSQARKKVDDAAEAVESATKKHEKANGELSKCADESRAAEKKIADIKATSAVIRILGLCEECKIRLRSLYEGQIKEAKETINASMQQGKAFGARLEETAETVRCAKMDLDSAQLQVQEITRKRAILQGRLDAARDAKPVRSVAVIEAETAKATEKREAARVVVETIEAWQSRNASVETIEYLEREIANLSWAVSMFDADPKHSGGQAYAASASGPLQEFADKCNEALRPYGMSLRYEICKVVTPILTTSKGRDVDLTDCSGGEKLLAAFAIGKRFSGDNGYVSVDEINDLDGDNRARFIAALKDHHGSALVCCAWPFRADQFDLVKQQAAWEPVRVRWMDELGVLK